MEFKNVRKRVEQYCRLQMYKFPPEQSISINEFEDLALQRLKRRFLFDAQGYFICCS